MGRAEIYDEQRCMASRLIDDRYSRATRKRFEHLVRWQGSPQEPDPRRNATPPEGREQYDEYKRSVPDCFVSSLLSYLYVDSSLHYIKVVETQTMLEFSN
jgi:hypothetical protein